MSIIDEKAIFNNDIARGVPMSNTDDYFVTNENIKRGEMPAFIWTDPQILDEKAKAKYLEMPTGDRPRFIIELLEQFYRNNPEYSDFVRVEIYKHPLRLLEFFQGVKPEHLTRIEANEPERIRDALRQSIEAAERSIAETPIDINDLTTFWPILKIRDLFTESQLAELYYIQNPKARPIDPEKLEHITAIRAEKIEYPIDKPNHYIWRLLEKDTKGQIRFNMLPKESELKAMAIYSIDFSALDNVKISKRLTPFDKRVYIAISALYNAGNEYISATQIYYAMGNTSKPGTTAIQRINDSITKMQFARITFDNESEAALLEGYDHFKYKGALLQIEQFAGIINGRESEAFIHVFREPPLMTFAKKRHQVTTIEAKLLQSPISKTDSNLLIDDYLIERISKEKRKEKASCTILLKTLYEYADINTIKRRQRAPEKIRKYLDYYKETGFIKTFTIEDDKIIIILGKEATQ